MSCGQADLAVEILDQAAAPDRIEVERVDQRVEQRHVAGADLDVGDAEGRGGFQRQRQHLGIGRGAILPAEGFDRRPAGIRSAGRRDSGTPVRDSRIRPAGRRAAGGEIVARHGDGQVGAQAELLAARVRRQVEALADVLAGEVEERLGRLQDRGLRALT